MDIQSVDFAGSENLRQILHISQHELQVGQSHLPGFPHGLQQHPRFALHADKTLRRVLFGRLSQILPLACTQLHEQRSVSRKTGLPLAAARKRIVIHGHYIGIFPERIHHAGSSAQTSHAGETPTFDFSRGRILPDSGTK